MATPSSRKNSIAAAKIVGPSARNTAMDKAMNDRADLIKRGTTQTELNNSREQRAVAVRANSNVVAGNSVKKLNPQGKTMGQIAGEVASRTSTLQGAGGVLGGQHAGGHSDVMGAINMGGFTVKTPIIKPTSTKNK
jgi:hypothetical protein